MTFFAEMRRRFIKVMLRHRAQKTIEHYDTYTQRHIYDLGDDCRFGIRDVWFHVFSEYYLVKTICVRHN